MLVGGVSAKMTWQRFFGADDERQPPLRLTAMLDMLARAGHVVTDLISKTVLVGDVGALDKEAGA